MYAADTTVPVEKSRAEIERLLSRHKCSSFASGTDYDANLVTIQFKAHDRFIRFTVQLPKRGQFSNGSAGDKRFSQQERQRWRALLLVIKAKLESVENSIATFEEEFLAHIVMPNNQTVGKMILPQIASAYKSGGMPQHLLEASYPKAAEKGSGQ